MTLQGPAAPRVAAVKQPGICIELLGLEEPFFATLHCLGLFLSACLLEGIHDPLSVAFLLNRLPELGAFLTLTSWNVATTTTTTTPEDVGVSDSYQ